MPKKTKKKSQTARKKPEDFVRKRKIRFAIIRLNKILKLMLVLMFLVLVVWIGFFDGYEVIRSAFRKVAGKATVAMGLEVKEVEILGNQIVTHKEIVNAIYASTEFQNIPILLLDLEDLQKSIASVGWVDYANVRLVLPSKIIVEVTERKPEFIWQKGGRIWLSDNKGNLISNKLSSGNIALPVVVGNEPKQDISELYEITSPVKYLYDNITNATKIGNRRWDVTLKKTIKIKLPEKDAVVAWKKLADLDKKNNILSKKISYIDLRIEKQIITGF